MAAADLLRRMLGIPEPHAEHRDPVRPAPRIIPAGDVDRLIEQALWERRVRDMESGWLPRYRAADARDD